MNSEFCNFNHHQIEIETVAVNKCQKLYLFRYIYKLIFKYSLINVVCWGIILWRVFAQKQPALVPIHFLKRTNLMARVTAEAGSLQNIRGDFLFNALIESDRGPFLTSLSNSESKCSNTSVPKVSRQRRTHCAAQSTGL